MSAPLLKALFRDPPREYRIKPFWFWNGEITEEEIDWQLREMADKGIGGVFICPRQGMTVPYLSERWFSLVRYACERAAAHGLEAWLYDEYPYPSGVAGGEVLALHPDAKQTVLQPVLEDIEGGKATDIELPWGKLLYAKAVPVRDGAAVWDEAIDVAKYVGVRQEQQLFQQTGLTIYSDKRYFTYGPAKRLVYAPPADGTWRIIAAVQSEVNDFKYYGAYIDPCDRQAVASFLVVTHERYAQTLGGMMGHAVKGMFSDEVGFLGGIPWSRHIPAHFFADHGYRVEEHLGALYDKNYPDAYKIRHNFYTAAAALFRASYHRQCADWCDQHGVRFATEVPSMRMSTQRYSHIPGGDSAHEKLGRGLEWILDTYSTTYRANPKFPASLARQLARPFAMTESFHSVGWTMTLQDAKWMLDRLAAQGINLFNFHAFYYTIETLKKHDAPPSQFLQNPYWEHYRRLADYAGRLSAVITHTQSAGTVAVLVPVTALWTRLASPMHNFRYAGTDEAEREELAQYTEAWKEIMVTLSKALIDYDHLDGDILREAEIQDGWLVLGNARYNVLVLPPMDSIESEVTGKIEAFIRFGGHVIFTGERPSRIIDEDVCVAERYAAMSGPNVHSVTADQLPALLLDITKPPVRFEAAGEGFLYSLRQNEADEYFAFIANQQGEDVSGALHITGGGLSSATLYDLETGGTIPLALAQCEVGHRLPLTFGPYESKLINLSGTAAHAVSMNRDDMQRIELDLSEPMGVTIEGGNILRYDTMEMNVNGRDWGHMPVRTFIEQYAITADGNALDSTFSSGFGVPRRLSVKYPLDVRYTARFDAQALPPALGLLLDRHTLDGEYSILVNGTSLDLGSCKPVFINDRNNILYDIAQLVRMGENEIEIRVNVSRDWHGVRDNIYLCGDFSPERGADGIWSLVPAAETARLRGTYIEGFPFYAGTFAFTGTVRVPAGQDVILALPRDADIYDCVSVSVNGVDLGVRPWTPYEWRCPAYALSPSGENRLEIQLTNTLAGMLDGRYFDYRAHTRREI